MKIFEFAFNPKKSKDRFFEVFSYEPKSPKEKPKGSLYVVGELQNALEFHSRFLHTISRILQEEYYASPVKSAEAALKAGLKKLNEFLSQEAKKGNVDWLGNLHVAALLFITIGEKKTVFHLARTGTVKVLLWRNGTLVDVGKKLDVNASGHSVKIFGNIASGKVFPHDHIVVTTKDIHDVFSREKALLTLGSLTEGKQFKDFFAKRQKILSRFSGILFSALIEQEQAKRKQAVLRLFPTISLPKPRLMLPKGVRVPSLPALNFPLLRPPSASKKQLTLVILFLILLFLGALLFS
jgi:hypothetical protein